MPNLFVLLTAFQDGLIFELQSNVASVGLSVR